MRHGYLGHSFDLCHWRRHPQLCSLVPTSAETKYFIWVSSSYLCPTCLTSWLNPLMRTEFLASSHRSLLDSLKIWAAMLYSSINGSWTRGVRHPDTRFVCTLVKWNWRGSSVDRDTLRPLEIKTFHIEASANVRSNSFCSSVKTYHIEASGNLNLLFIQKSVTWQGSPGKGICCSWGKGSCWREGS